MEKLELHDCSIVISSTSHLIDSRDIYAEDGTF